MLHLPIWSIYLVSLHYHQRLSGESFRWGDLAMLVCLTLSTAAAYYINQVYDVESDRFNRKLGFLHDGLITAGKIRTGYLVLSIIAIAAAALFSAAILVIFLLAFVMGFVYSAPPLRLKDRAVWGLLVNAAGIGFLVPLTVMPDLSFHNAGLLGWDTPLYFFFAVASIYVLTTVPDRDGDAIIGKRTLAVILPHTASLTIALALAAAAAYTAYHSQLTFLFYISLLSAALIVAPMLTRNIKFILLAAKAPILLLALLAGYFFPLYLVFIVATIFASRVYYRRRFDVVYPKLA